MKLYFVYKNHCINQTHVIKSSNRLFGWCATTNTIFVEDDARFEDISNERQLC